MSDNRNAPLGTQSVTISAGGMKTLDLHELQTAPTTEGGVRVSYEGPSDALLINGGLQDASVGYSANLRFATPPRALPSLAHAVTHLAIAELDLMTGAADPMMHFPAGTTFMPYTMVRNVSNGAISVSPALWWMQGGAPASFPLPQFTLPPHETRNLDMRSLLGAAGLSNFSGSVNLELDTQGKLGVLIAGGSVDQTNSYVFEVSARGIAESAGKSLSYWSTANGDDTMVTIWNPADEPQDFVFRLEFSGGHYSYPIHLDPRATRSFNVSEVIASQLPDAQGNVIPMGIREGSAKLVGSEADNQHILVAVDSGIYNVRRATCYQQCTTCDGATSYSVLINPFGVGVGGRQQESLVAYWDTGAQVDVTSQSGWSSNNTSVATVGNQTGLVNGIAAGSFVLSAGNSTEPDYANDCNPYTNCPVASGGGGSAPGDTTPTITSISPTFLNAGDSKKSLTINGAGFGSSPTVNLPSGVTLDSTNQQTASDSQIQLSAVDVAATTYIGANSITVTANGQTSAPAGFTIDGPDHMIVKNDIIGHCSGCTTTITRTVTYQIIKFSGSPVFVIPIGEVFSKSGWSCTGSDPGIITTPCTSGLDTQPDGTFLDRWSVMSDRTPAGCGWNVTDHWQWCTAPKWVGTLTGYIHTNACSINGVVNPPTPFPLNQPIYP